MELPLEILKFFNFKISICSKVQNLVLEEFCLYPFHFKFFFIFLTNLIGRCNYEKNEPISLNTDMFADFSENTLDLSNDN